MVDLLAALEQALRRTRRTDSVDGRGDHCEACDGHGYHINHGWLGSSEPSRTECAACGGTGKEKPA